jgi:exodeoxyribonuclease VIII
MSEPLEKYQAEQQYHNRAEVSRSDLIEFRRSPAHFLHYREQEQQEKTAAMLFGEAYHLAVLEPEKFSKFVGALTEEIKAEPDKSWASKANQRAKEEYQAAIPIVLSEQDYETILAMRDKLLDKPNILDFLQPDIVKVEVEQYGELAGVPLRCKLDIKHPYFLADLKTAQSAEPNYARKQVRFQDYYYQAAMYADIERMQRGEQDIKPFYFIFQEKSAPYEASVIHVGEELIDRGLEEYQKDVKLLSACYKADTWPGYEYWSNDLDQTFKAKLWQS